MMSGDKGSSATRARVMSAVLTLELLWLLLVTASVVFLAAHLGPGAEEFSSDATVRGVLLIAGPPVAIVVGLALIGARQAIDRVTAAPHASLSGTLRVALWLSAIANAAVVLSILTSLYHAHMTWIVVGLLLAVGLSAVAWACVRAARQ
jgi:hypothetical protein